MNNDLENVETQENIVERLGMSVGQFVNMALEQEEKRKRQEEFLEDKMGILMFIMVSERVSNKEYMTLPEFQYITGWDFEKILSYMETFCIDSKEDDGMTIYNSHQFLNILVTDCSTFYEMEME